MPTTFLDVQNRINLDYLNRTDLSAETKRSLIRAVRHYEKERFWFNTTATAINASTASTGMVLPADFLALDFVTVRTVTGGSADNIVSMRTFERVAYQNRSLTSGVPEEVALRGNSIHFFPRASSAFPVTIYYTHALTTLSADADTNDWLSAAEDLIVHHAAADMIANVLRGDPIQYANHKQWEAEAYALLQYGRNIRMMTGEDNGMPSNIQRHVLASKKLDGGPMPPVKPGQ